MSLFYNMTFNYNYNSVINCYEQTDIKAKYRIQLVREKIQRNEK